MNAKNMNNPLHIDFVNDASEKSPHKLVHTVPLRILVVDDDPIAANDLAQNARDQGHSINICASGPEALGFLRKHPGTVDFIMLDRIMPGMDGLAVVKAIKEDTLLRPIPIIMVTDISGGGMEDWLNEGVIYYITKPVNSFALSAVLAAAAREMHNILPLNADLKKYRTNFEMIDTCRFRYQTVTQAETLAGFIALCFPDPQRVLTGLGELMLNAVEHGNLGIGYTRKSELIESNSWRREIERREKLEHNLKKFVTVTVKRQPNGVGVIIEDEGDGFDWQRYLTIDLVRSGHNHGRGIAQSKAMSFDQLVYNKEGNQAIGFVKNTSNLDW